MEKGYRRTKLLVDPKWQYRVFGFTAGAAIAAGVLHYLAATALVCWLPIEEMTGSDVSMLVIEINSVYFVLLAAVLWFVTLRLTHKVAGPAQVLMRALVGLRNGEYKHRTKLRDGDYLQELASVVGTLAADLEQRSARERQFLTDIESVLDAETAGRVREMACRVFAAPAPTGSEPASAPDGVNSLPSLVAAMSAAPQALPQEQATS